MGNEIEGLRWKPVWVSHLGCIKGCLDHLKLDVSDAWLFGATGHAFVINVHDELCPSGPTAWHTEMLFKLGWNVGYTIDGVVGFKSDDDFARKQRQAWDNTVQAIDEGLPCYGWELSIPEYYVVHGYDDQDRYLVRPQYNRGEEPVPWRKLGDSEIGVLEMYTVRPGKAADDATAVRDALTFALDHSESPPRWIFPRYSAGLGGFDNWIGAFESGTANDFGAAYNASVWHECRGLAAEFLREARDRVDGAASPLFDEAVEHYEVVAQHLEEVVKMFPFPPKGDEVKDTDLCKTAIQQLREARKAEEAGLGTLRRIVDQL